MINKYTMFTPELQRSMRTSTQQIQNTPGGRSLTPLSSSTPRRKSVGHIPLSSSWGGSPSTRQALQEANRQRAGSFSLPRRASLSNNLEKSALSRSTLRIPSADDDSVFIGKEVTFRDSLRGSVQSLNKYEPSQLYVFDDTTQSQSSLVRSNSAMEFEQTLFEKTALRHARRLRLQEEVTELCQETALMQEKTAKLMANTARVRRLRIQLDMDLLDVDNLCVSSRLCKDSQGGPPGHDETMALPDDKIYQEIDVINVQQSRKHYEEEKENRVMSSPFAKKQGNTQVQTNRAAKLRSNSIRKQRDGNPGNLLHEKPPAIPRFRKDAKRSRLDFSNKEANSSIHNLSRVSLKEKHPDQEQPEKEQVDKVVPEKKNGFQLKLKKVSKKLSVSRLSLDKKVDLSVESTWL